MKLYHYGFKRDILEEGLVAFYKHVDTNLINHLIRKSFGECFGRDYCVFFNLDRRDEGNITVSVDSKNLDSNLLYVADQDIANAIYSTWYKDGDYSKLVEQYVSSIVRFEDYNREYSNAEVFYLDDVPVELLNIESVDLDDAV